jgi:hypothetical protein
MTLLPVHQCECEDCRSLLPHPERTFHHQINLLASRLNEQQRRWFIALEALRVGRGGQRRLEQISGMERHTIERGSRELQAELSACPSERLRAPGGGRPTAEERDPQLLGVLETLVAPETAGDPMGRRVKATRSSLAHLSQALTQAGHPASRPTVARLLRKLDYSPKVNARRADARSSPAERNAQFEHIAVQRKRFHASGDPVISVDAKKRADR